MSVMMVELDHKIRCNTYDVMFSGNGGFEDKSIATIVLDAIAKCPKDLRRGLL